MFLRKWKIAPSMQTGAPALTRSTTPYYPQDALWSSLHWTHMFYNQQSAALVCHPIQVKQSVDRGQSTDGGMESERIGPSMWARAKSAMMRRVGKKRCLWNWKGYEQKWGEGMRVLGKSLLSLYVRRARNGAQRGPIVPLHSHHSRSHYNSLHTPPPLSQIAQYTPLPVPICIVPQKSQRCMSCKVQVFTERVLKTQSQYWSVVSVTYPCGLSL